MKEGERESKREREERERSVIYIIKKEKAQAQKFSVEMSERSQYREILKHFNTPKGRRYMYM